ncbi:MAG: DNA ligase (NAD(+)) LigA, partial [Bacteroidota bacterium]|nr:DNA ligase (NAD(+)) LigA [Bacteroidota bacterium]
MAHSKEAGKELLMLTDKLVRLNVAQIKSAEEADQVLDELERVVIYHDHRYYIEASPLITDKEYDQLFSSLKDLENRFPGLKSPDSPTQRVPGGLTKDFPTVPHLVPMLSLDNSYDEVDLKEFDRKVKELSGRAEISYTVEPKYDGSSISLVYVNDNIVRGVTRGDGIMGEEITPNVKIMRTIPLKTSFSRYGIHT